MVADSCAVPASSLAVNVAVAIPPSVDLSMLLLPIDPRSVWKFTGVKSGMCPGKGVGSGVELVPSVE